MLWMVVLQGRFGAGVSLTIKVPVTTSESDVKALSEKIIRLFPGTRLKESHYGVLRFVVSNLPWSTIFSKMEEVKHEHSLDDYAVAQATLEEVFLEFAEKQVLSAD